MSPRKFEEIVDEYEAEGLDTTELRAAWEASPLRKDRDEAVKRAEAALAEAKRYQQVVAGQRFKEFGIKVRPEHLRTPDDLDWADETKVREWATTAGLIEAPDPAVADPEVEAHGRMAAASGGADRPPAHNSTEDLNARIAAAQNPEEVMAVVRAAGGSTPQQ